ncbi:hypothetical protein KKB64_05010 [Patescibacteria group bacterium]|nr:hypothetical protein [Patescibacteria group bacterium]MBU2459647.1 hypothetical protein [Patescibacteria group bacterium]MBU2544450.1 hypothetical protein [Patescibacteria group bacterium]
MRKKMRKKVHTSGSLSWLPIDSRLLPPLFSFSYVRGFARWFLIVEMLLATITVFGAVLLIVLKFI